MEEPPKPVRQEPLPPPVVLDRAIDVGDRILVLRTGQEGIVSAIPPGRSEIEIQIGSFKMRAKLKDVRLVARSEDQAQPDESRYGEARALCAAKARRRTWNSTCVAGG